MDFTEPKNIIGALLVVIVVFGGIVLFTKAPAGNKDTTASVSGSTGSSAAQPQEKNVMHATLTTSRGVISLDLYPDAAPKTVENFVAKAKAGYFNGLKIHRVEDWVIQGGDPLSRDDAKKQYWGTGGGDIPTELSQKPFVVGALGVARGPDIKVSNDSQFFIVKTDAQFLNGQYTLFGQVTAGMDVVNATQIGDVIQSVAIE